MAQINSTQTLTKAMLSARLNEVHGDSRSRCEELVETFFEVIAQNLERGEEVKLSGFGNFKLIDKPPRPGRNPKTLEEKEISARRVVTFKGGGKLKSRIEKLDPAVVGIDSLGSDGALDDADE